MQRKSFLLALMLSPLPLLAQSIEQLTGAMRARVPQVDTLKRAGLVGEDNRGYLAIRGSVNASQRGIVDAENADRRAVYASIARRRGVSAAEVGRQRAEQNRNSAASGVWVQGADGRWRRD